MTCDPMGIKIIALVGDLAVVEHEDVDRIWSQDRSPRPAPKQENPHLHGSCIQVQGQLDLPAQGFREWKEEEHILGCL